MIQPGFNVLIDGQWGSTGKGKVASWLAEHFDIDVAVSDFQANAGHTTIMDDGQKFVVHSVPSAAINEDCKLAISPAATISMERLISEIEYFNLYKKGRLMIHPNACIIQNMHIQDEMLEMKGIASTCQGVGAALAHKIRRQKDVKLASEVDSIKEFIGDTVFFINGALSGGATVLAESAQGFDLSLNFGHIYPCVTSRDVTVGSILNNAGVSPFWLKEVIGVIRTYPIRVGHIVEEGKEIGNSGGWYSDQEELTWNDITERSGSHENLIEMTTVTGRVRRVFTFSKAQFRKFLLVCQPTRLAINFVNYLDYRINHHINNEVGFAKYRDCPDIINFVNEVKAVYNESSMNVTADRPQMTVNYLGTGPKMSQCLYRKNGF